MIELSPMIAAARPAYTSVLPVRWGEMDAMRHVNNAMYLRLMEENRIEWFQSIGTNLGAPKGHMPVMVNIYCEYLRPITWPAAVETAIYVGELGRSSVQTFHTLDVGGSRCAQSAVKLVWIDVATGKSVPLPENVRSVLAG
jgi:acyl-CoA thioester hydrolase